MDPAGLSERDSGGLPNDLVNWFQNLGRILKGNEESSITFGYECGTF
jgi:hypothetical protein